ncbi:MAG: type IV pilus twitching motility protein PilT [Armatimonadota bacterium]
MATPLVFDDVFMHMVENNASDLHLAANTPPVIRIDGTLRHSPYPRLTSCEVQELVYSILTDVQVTRFERQHELDFGYQFRDIARFRANVYFKRGNVGAVFRTIPSSMPTLEMLDMPPIVTEFTKLPRGLVLVTGPTGSGKSTTLAAMIHEINRTRSEHIVTVEEPIEFLHENVMSIVSQREVGEDTDSFATALRFVLRQDPDVILIGEMRDLETISAAVTAAETGHLVFATLHTTSAAQTIDRIIDVFPPHQQSQIRNQVANFLEGIISQTLLPKIGGTGRVAAQEIITGTNAMRTLIREGKVHQMQGIIQSSSRQGMQTLEQSLRNLVKNGQVSVEEAMKKTSNPEDFKSLMEMI